MAGKATRGAKYYEFEEGYRVGRDGSLWSRWTEGLPEPGKWQQLQGSRAPNGLVVVTRSRTRYNVAHLVLEAFVGPRPPRAVAKYTDGDLENLDAGNLSWGPVVRRSALTAEIAAKAAKLQAKGMGVEAIAKKLGLEETGELQKALSGKTWNAATGIARPATKRKTILNEKLVLEAVRLSEEEGLAPGDIAERIGIGRARALLIKQVLNGALWGHVTGRSRRK
jgi:hypothetical protein